MAGFFFTMDTKTVAHNLSNLDTAPRSTRLFKSKGYGMQKVVNFLVGIGLTAVSIAGLSIGTVSAQTVTKSYVFTGVVSNDTANAFNGSFSLLDTAGTYTLTSFSASYRSSLFDTSNSSIYQSNPYLLYVGGNSSGPTELAPGTNDFQFYFDPVAGIFTNPGIVSSTQIPGYNNVSLSAAPAGAVPEPVTWGMMIVGFGLVGGTMRRRKSIVTARLSYAA